MKEVWNNRQIPNLVTSNQILKNKDNKTYFMERQWLSKRLTLVIQIPVNH